jgi:hypothetical protein
MKKIIIILGAIALCLTGTTVASDTKIEVPVSVLNADYQTLPISSGMSRVENHVREAAVKVSRLAGGHGSGSLISYRGTQFIITAQHVANGRLGSVYMISKNAQNKIAILVHGDPLNDIAVLWLSPEEEIADVRPMPWRPLETLPRVGTIINYSGHPSSHSLLSFRGSIAGYETHPEAGIQIILNVFGWFGSSGSVIYNDAGRIVGILWGVDVDYYSGQPQVNEGIVWVSPIQNLDMALALAPLCTQIPDIVSACN